MKSQNGINIDRIMTRFKAWKIDETLAKQILVRDKVCYYCKNKFDESLRSTHAEIEHIDNDAKNISLENIVLCCGHCNRSKGNKQLSDWKNRWYEK